MNKAQNSTLAILSFIFGVVFTYLGWDMINGFFVLIDSTFFKILWIIGALAIWGCNVVLIPYLLLIGESPIRWWHAIKGLMAFIVASFVCYLSYWVIPPIIETIDAMTGDMNIPVIGDLGWFILVIFWVIGLIVYPLILALRGGIKVRENE